MELTLRAGCWTKFCTQLVKVICPYSYYNLFYPPSCGQVLRSTPSTLQAVPPYSNIYIYIYIYIYILDAPNSDIRWESLKELSSVLQHWRNSRSIVYNGTFRYHLREINNVKQSQDLKIPKTLVIIFDSLPNVVKPSNRTTNTNSYTINNYTYLCHLHFHLNDFPRGFRHFPERRQLKL